MEPPPPSFLAVRTSGPLAHKTGEATQEQPDRLTLSIPPVWLVAVGIVLAAWIGWIAYSAAERGVDAGIGVLVAWPALLAMAAIVTAPIAALAVFSVRALRS